MARTVGERSPDGVRRSFLHRERPSRRRSGGRKRRARYPRRTTRPPKRWPVVRSRLQVPVFAAPLSYAISDGCSPAPPVELRRRYERKPRLRRRNETRTGQNVQATGEHLGHVAVLLCQSGRRLELGASSAGSRFRRLLQECQRALVGVARHGAIQRGKRALRPVERRADPLVANVPPALHGLDALALGSARRLAPCRVNQA